MPHYGRQHSSNLLNTPVHFSTAGCPKILDRISQPRELLNCLILQKFPEQLYISESLFVSEYQDKSITWSTTKGNCPPVGNFSIFSQPKIKLGYLVHCSQSLSQIQQNYRRTHAGSPSSRESILIWVQSFQDHGTMETQRVERTSRTSEDVIRGSSYFNREPRRSVHTAKAD